MGIEQYQGLLKLLAGVSFFIIMLLVLRLLSKRTGPVSAGRNHSPPWTDLESLRLIEIIQETHNIISIIFQRNSGHLFPQFKPGQFLSFQIGSDPKVVRSYSISSSDTNRRNLQVSIKRIDGGIGSEWFHSLKVGAIVSAYPPSGHFVDDRSKGQRIYVAGGIGLTPILSMIISNLENALLNQMTLFYGVRTSDDLAFHVLLEYLSKRHAHFSYYPILSHDHGWPGEKGFLNLDFILQKIESIKDARFFICGPEPMTEPLIDSLFAHGVSENQIFNEKFISPSNFDVSSLPERKVKISCGGKDFHYQGRKTLLEFLEENGEAIPFACRTGVCGTCKCRALGKINMLTNTGLTAKERREGLTLACVAYPESDIVIETLA